MKKEYKVSVVVPAYNEAQTIDELLRQLVPVLKKYPMYEVIFVNDGSTDETLSVLEKAHRKNKQVQYLSFSRNFGHQAALRAGLEHASGDCVISMDADLQHPVAVIDQMIEKWLQGAEVVNTLRLENKNQSWLKRKTSNLFYKIMGFMTNVRVPKGAADFRLLDKKVVAVLKTSTERNLFLRGYIYWMGFKQDSIPYQVGKRFAGKSSYTVRKMLMLAWAGITSFGIMPLRLASVLGFLTTGIGFAYACYVLYMKMFTHAFVVTGWASVLVSVLILGGIQLIIIGILGEYLGLIYLESKHRPSYIVSVSSLDETPVQKKKEKKS